MCSQHRKSVRKNLNSPQAGIKTEREGEFADYIWIIMDTVDTEPLSYQKLQHTAEPSGKHAYFRGLKILVCQS